MCCDLSHLNLTCYQCLIKTCLIKNNVDFLFDLRDTTSLKLKIIKEKNDVADSAEVTTKNNLSTINHFKMCTILIRRIQDWTSYIALKYSLI